MFVILLWFLNHHPPSPNNVVLATRFSKKCSNTTQHGQSGEGVWELTRKTRSRTRVWWAAQIYAWWLYQMEVSKWGWDAYIYMLQNKDNGDCHRVSISSSFRFYMCVDFENRNFTWLPVAVFIWRMLSSIFGSIFADSLFGFIFPRSFSDPCEKRNIVSSEIKGLIFAKKKNTQKYTQM